MHYQAWPRPPLLSTWFLAKCVASSTINTAGKKAMTASAPAPSALIAAQTKNRAEYVNTRSSALLTILFLDIICMSLPSLI
jgi:hypothetical protein